MKIPAKSKLFLYAGFGLLFVCAVAVARDSSQEPKAAAKKDGKARAGGTRDPLIDLHAAMSVDLPAARDLQAMPFQTPDGKAGWVLRLPGGRPIATPAYADGMLFVGGGYGSHDFYAVDAESGKTIWKIQTGDDGPSAAVVSDGFVAFNTESCTLVVVDEKTGKLVWQEWLGDPLMSQPAIDKGVLYMAHPAATGRPQQRAEFHPQPASPGASHRLLAADLKNGHHLWEQQISGDAMTAPVISDGVVYVTTLNGTSYAFNGSDGSVVWVKKDASTSAPVISGGTVYQTRKESRRGVDYEGLTRKDAKEGRQRDSELIAQSTADYLKKGNGGGVALAPAAVQSLDAAVGFVSAPGSSQLSAANETLGITTVAGAWAYQGSRAAISRGQILNAQGNHINSVRASDGKQTWQAEVVGAGGASGAQIFSPPSLGREYMYLVAGDGHLVSLRQKDGAVGFSYAMKAPMTFQPALAKGNLYAGTSDGRLICLKTGNPDADGWYAWGGNAQHNKIQ